MRGLFDDKILALYSRGLLTRDIEAHLEDIYGVSVGRDLISKVTDAVIDDVPAWSQRPLEDVYPVIFPDALVLKIRENGTAQRRACYITVKQSDQRRAPGRLSRQGPPALRWALYEAAQQARHPRSPDRDYSLQVAHRLGGNRACLGLARKILKRCYHTLRDLGEDGLAPA